MNILFYVPGMTFNGGTLAAGKSLGGSESAGYYLARELARRGHEVTVFGALSPGEEGRWDDVRYRSAGPASAAWPHGEAFGRHAESRPHDVLIAQRVPDVFYRRYHSKLNLWWTHDLPLKRFLPALAGQLWNLDGILAVSHWHARLVAEVYPVRPEEVHTVPNGIDPDLFAARVPAEAKRAGKVLVYSSRPERGLEHLVKPGGIMERLHQADPEIVLRVCAYDNTMPQAAPFYEALWERCRTLPNVELVGALSKRDLAALMGSAWLHVYPTLFEEVSCITAMEAQAAGTPFITTPTAALPETLAEAGAVWVRNTAAGAVDVEGFVRRILSLRDHPERWRALHQAALRAAEGYGWGRSADSLEAVIEDAFQRRANRPERLLRHFLRHSDIVAARRFLDTEAGRAAPPRWRAELDTHYGFAFTGNPQDLADHYEALARYETERGLDHGLNRPEEILRMPRCAALLPDLAALSAGALVVDYACGQGHFTAAAARRFPHLRFVGLDIAAQNIAVGREALAGAGIANLELLTLADLPALQGRADLVIAAEVMEHVPDPAALVDGTLEPLLKPEARLVVTVPSGPWESVSYGLHPFRIHLHHFERADLADLLGGKADFSAEYVAGRPTHLGEPLGHHVLRWRAPAQRARCGAIDYGRKFCRQAPRETLAVCMIVKPGGETLARTLNSVRALADEIVIGIDGDRAPAGRTAGAAPAGRAWAIAEEFGAQAFSIASPLRTGFDDARNATIARAGSDWVLWIDDDEELLWPERLVKYLRPNGYDAYALAQHHFAVEPGGIIKTDYPCRLFRNGLGMRFYGVVHEHPELGLNQGPGRCLLLPDVAVCHNGYMTEEVRRRRFERNLPLMVRDREKYPQRILGKFLWIRDLAHLNRFEHEQTGGVSPRMLEQARQAVALWRELVQAGHVRLAVDALPYYSESAGLLTGAPIGFDIAVGGRSMGLGDPEGHPPAVIRGQFVEAADIERLTQALVREKIEPLTGRYM
jgi:glycosyltransferase involved in cell wall biosynthesis/2-polyprenyl-3-methyl-5-hydroxy-6-metoxy-1,4-benzoquinol methylase